MISYHYYIVPNDNLMYSINYNKFHISPYSTLQSDNNEKDICIYKNLIRKANKSEIDIFNNALENLVN